MPNAAVKTVVATGKKVHGSSNDDLMIYLVPW
ncbi:hypothetical protein EYZ11_005383 [Aspergillus tanneri]|uniref:Uncharacterized protein n=1 Tax=Aspergillus tanneri TaxID=1220188 RepID=A0A4S3JIP4_9EURO|nr:hypothetical protein EYZ11_005383 [Aspergillus tanneri]